MKKVKDRFSLKLSPPAPNNIDMRPTDRILTIDGQSGQARARLLGWGWRVDWNAKPLINARAESLAAKMTFRGQLQQRCLIPATAYFEWQRPTGGAKQKMRIHPQAPHSQGTHSQDAGLFAMAGLIGPDQDSVTLITCTPCADIADIHTRMPVILNRADETKWIDPDRSFPDVQRFLRPYTQGMVAQNVDKNPVLL